MNLLALAILQSFSLGAPVAPSAAPPISVGLRPPVVEAVAVAPALDAQPQLVTAASVALTAAVYPSAWPRVFEARATGKYFGARYYSGGMGRFTTPDLPFADQEATDPQSWNLYSYTRNRPTTSVDVGGYFVATITGGITGGLIGGAVEYFRGGSFAEGAVKGAISGAVAGSIIDTGGASLGVLALSGAAGGLAGGAIERAVGGEATTAGALLTDATVGAAGGVIGGKLGEAVVNKVTEGFLKGVARETVATLGPGKGGAYGTAAHTLFEKSVNSSTFGAKVLNLSTEVSYAGRDVVKRGTAGSVRPDVVRGSIARPGAVFDLKTGSAQITPAWAARVNANLPSPVPIKEIKPPL